MRMTTRKLFFIISEEDSGPKKPLVWCELPVHFYFKEYNVVGFNEHYNEIYLEFSTGINLELFVSMSIKYFIISVLLARSLSVIKQNVQSLKIKLTNKDSPCLTLEIEMMSGELLSRQCVHDIPVDVISRKHWSDYEEPRFNDFHVIILQLTPKYRQPVIRVFQVSIEMPNLKAVKPIVEHMRNMSNNLTLSANRSGRLTLKIQTNLVKLSTHFQDLNVESFAGKTDSIEWLKFIYSCILLNSWSDSNTARRN